MKNAATESPSAGAKSKPRYLSDDERSELMADLRAVLDDCEEQEWGAADYHLGLVGRHITLALARENAARLEA